MSAPVLTFFNNKSGVGKTSLTYHLAWMYANLGKRVVIADLDPQASLTAALLDEEHIETLWNSKTPGSTIYQSIKALTNAGEIASPVLNKVATNLYLLPGDMALSGFEDTLAAEWSHSMADNNLYHSLRILTAFWQVVQMASTKVKADIILVDTAPNLGAINRSALLATDFVAIPLGTDLFSIRSLTNLGPILNSWKSGWHNREENWHNSQEQSRYPAFKLPAGYMKPIGYLCQQHGVRLGRPVRAYDKWVQRIPAVYREAVLNEKPMPDMSLGADPYCLAITKHYRSLIPMGQEHRKPIFNLTSADGAIGSHASAVSDARKDFKQLAIKIGEKVGVEV